MSCESDKYFKPGSRFKATCTIPTVEGGLTSLDGWTITSAVKTSDGVTHPSDSVTVDGMKVTVIIDDTDAWPIGIAKQDLKFTETANPLNRIPTRTWQFMVDERIT